MKNKISDLHQFDIVEAYLGPTRGSEQRGYRPCVILLTNAVSQNGTTTILAPLTTSIGRVYPYEVLVHPTKSNGLQKVSKIKFDQLRVADRSRVAKSIGKLDVTLHYAIRTVISKIFDLSGTYLS